MFHPNGPTFFELARQALSSTERGYDLLAKKFDYTPFRTPDFILQPVQEKLIATGEFRQGIDLCCGTGAGIEVLLPACRDLVVGIDFSQGMLEQAQQVLAEKQLPSRYELIRCNTFDLPFADQFDVAVCFGALGHIVPRKQADFVAQVARVLKPGGKFFFVTSNMPPVLSPNYLFARGFNAAMHLRNLLLRPPFLMFYLTFLLPESTALLQQHGFEIQLHEELFTGSLSRLCCVEATRS